MNLVHNYKKRLIITGSIVIAVTIVLFTSYFITKNNLDKIKTPDKSIQTPIGDGKVAKTEDQKSTTNLAPIDYETVLCRIIVDGKQRMALTGKTKSISYAKVNYSGHIKIQALDGTTLDEFDNNISEINIQVDVKEIDVKDKIHITGKARVFENTIAGRLLDINNKVIIETNVMTNAKDVDQFGDFTFDIPVDRSKINGKSGVFEIYSVSMKDGSILDKVDIKVNYK